LIVIFFFFFSLKQKKPLDASHMPVFANRRNSEEILSEPELEEQFAEHSVELSSSLTALPRLASVPKDVNMPSSSIANLPINRSESAAVPSVARQRPDDTTRAASMIAVPVPSRSRAGSGAFVRPVRRPSVYAVPDERTKSMRVVRKSALQKHKREN
jgi:hypothetical protein